MSAILMANMAVGFANGFAKSLMLSQQARAQQRVYEQQAEVLRMNARSTRKAGAMNEDVLRSHMRSDLAERLAVAGEAGVGSSATTLSALATSAGAQVQNILNGRYEVESEAENYLYQAGIADENARQMRKKAKHRYGKAMMSGVSGALGL